MNSNSALANLTATYTDSENEDEISDESPKTESSQDSQVSTILSDCLDFVLSFKYLIF